MMARIIERYKKDKLHHPVFIDFYIENHWSTDLKEVMTEISRGIFSNKKKTKEFAEATVALRYFNRNMLRKIFKGQVVEEIVSEIINVSGLYSESNDKEYATLFSDGIIRNLHALYMLANQPDVMRVKCLEAQNLCWNEINSLSIKIEEFMVEYLFQCLQESIADSKNIHKKRHVIRRKFDRKVDEFVQKLAKMDRARKLRGDLGRALFGALKGQSNPEDADINKALFRFWVIYIYKEKLYALGVYRDFVARTEKLVRKYFGRRMA